jgi:hypothetical protein
MMFGWAKKAWHKVRNVAKKVGHFVKGVASTVVQIVKAVVHRFLGIVDLVGTLLGWMPEKKVSVEVVILTKDNKPLASEADVQVVIDMADELYHESMNVHIVNGQGRRPIVMPGPVPEGNLSVDCEALKVFGSHFTSVGGWFRDHQIHKTSGVSLGYGEPVTVFVIEDVEDGDLGCSPGFLADYAVIDPGALTGSEMRRLTLAHEVAHSCGLWHPISKRKNLMKHKASERSRRLGRLQKAVFRSSGHVTSGAGLITDNH